MPSILLPAEIQRPAQQPLRAAKASAVPFVIAQQETARQAQAQNAQLRRAQDRQEAQRQEAQRQNDLRQNDRRPVRQPSSVAQAPSDRMADNLRADRARPVAPDRDVVRPKPDASPRNAETHAAGSGDTAGNGKAAASGKANTVAKQDEASATSVSDAASESAATDKQAIESGKQEREAETAKADARDEAAEIPAGQEIAPEGAEEQTAGNAPEAQPGLALAKPLILAQPSILAQQLATAQQQVALADVAAGPQSTAGQAIKGAGTEAGAMPGASIPDAGAADTTANAATPGTPAAEADGTLAVDAGNHVSARKGEGRPAAEGSTDKPVPTAQLKELVAAFEQPQAFVPASLSPAGGPSRESLLSADTANAKAGGHQADADLRPTPLGALPIEIGMKALAGTKRFDIRLDPPELGRVDVRIEFGRDGEVSAHLIVDKVETLQLLQRDSRNLERAFDQAGLRTGDAGVQIALSDRNANGQNSGQNSGQTGDDPSSRSNRHRNGLSNTDTELSRALDAAPTRRLRLGGVDVSI